jgi:gliding motility-associated-like protein
LLTPEQLIKNVLVGKGVEVSNITYTGHEDAIGQFNGSQSNIGIDNGIIISTGTVKDETAQNGKKKGPIGPNNNNSEGSNWERIGDIDLSNLISEQTNDAAIIEFDFIPQGDLIEFEYVFASEEYLEQTKSAAGFFDVFAFFISGPGIIGQENLALVPGTNDVISIETINDKKNSHLYIDNGSGEISSDPTYSDDKITNFDGFTVPLIAVKQVQPCKTYHLKISIADVKDGLFDSGVFLKGGSLNSSPLFEPNQNTTVNIGIPNLLPEGCSDGILELTRTEDIDESLDINYRLFGSAENGVDYELLNGLASFGVNESKIVINLKPKQDALVEGEESVIFRFPNPNICIVDSVDYEFMVTDLASITSIPKSVSLNCPGGKIQIEANFEGGFSPYSYQWDNGDNTILSEVSPINTKEFEFTVTDVCGSFTSNKINVDVPQFDPLELTMSKDTSVVCAGLSVTLSGIPEGGAGGYLYAWETGESTASISPKIIESKKYKLVLKDLCGSQVDDYVEVELDYPILKVEIMSDTTVCPGDSVQLTADVHGGILPYYYEWENGALSESSVWASDVSRIISVSVYDSCRIIPAIDSAELTIQNPLASFIPGSTRLETGDVIRFISNSQGAVEIYKWDLGNGATSNEINASTIYDYDSSYTVKLVIIDSLGCIDSISQKIVVVPPFYLWVPNAFTPNLDGVNNEFEPKGIGIESYEIYIFSRWGEQVFYSKDLSDTWTGKYLSGEDAPLGVYIYKINALGENGRELKKIGRVSLIR